MAENSELVAPVPAVKRTTADRLDALEAAQAETHRLVAETHAAVLQVAQLAQQAGTMFEQSGGIAGLVGQVAGERGGATGAILQSLFRTRPRG